MREPSEEVKAEGGSMEQRLKDPGEDWKARAEENKRFGQRNFSSAEEPDSENLPSALVCSFLNLSLWSGEPRVLETSLLDPQQRPRVEEKVLKSFVEPKWRVGDQ